MLARAGGAAAHWWHPAGMGEPFPGRGPAPSWQLLPKSWCTVMDWAWSCLGPAACPGCNAATASTSPGSTSIAPGASPVLGDCWDTAVAEQVPQLPFAMPLPLDTRLMQQQSSRLGMANNCLLAPLSELQMVSLGWPWKVKSIYEQNRPLQCFI